MRSPEVDLPRNRTSGKKTRKCDTCCSVFAKYSQPDIKPWNIFEKWGFPPSDGFAGSSGFSETEPGEMQEPKLTKMEMKYAQSVRKMKRNSGEEYVTKNLKVVAAKVFENKDCFCLRKCLEYVLLEDRKTCFENFWKLGDFKKQNLLLCEAVRKRLIKRRRPRTSDKERRKCSYEYFLPTSSGGEVSVCKTFFLDTFKISAGRLSRALNADTAGTDLRGKTAGSSRKTSEDKIRIVREHISTFPDAKDCRGLGVRKMYANYLERCLERQESYVNEWTYRKVFNAEFKLDFQSPGTNT